MEDLKETLLHSPTGRQWKRIGIRPHYGIDIHLSALRTKEGSGIGEFLDLIPLIDWCKELQMDVIQLLPLNDTGSDPSPYNALSSCALNPIFLSLHELPYIQNDPELLKKLEELSPLNASNRILYNDVQSHKISFLHAYFDRYGAKVTKSKDFILFVSKNSWLDAYALFKVLKDKLGQNNFFTWPNELKYPSKKEFESLTKKYAKEMTFYFFLQYLCFSQLSSVKQYAKKNKILLKGDIPILISPDSADVWHYPEIFNLDFSAGAPPDFYNPEGQYWGFPIFNWQAMKKNKYHWWKQRLKYANHFYDLYRLDHVIGFFRLWAIPAHHSSKEGKFIPGDENLWAPQGREILETLVASSSMLPIAEDLGVIPPIVRSILQDLGICGTKVMRWERMWNEDKRFIPIQNYPPISLTCVSTHDSTTLALWWKESPDEAKDYAAFKEWTYTPELSFSQRFHILRESNESPSLFHINLLQEYLALLPEFVWPSLDDERINIPGKITPNNWTYRFRLSLEEMSSHKTLTEEIRKTLPSLTQDL
jgi:4-alpha-glucanotransferase